MDWLTLIVTVLSGVLGVQWLLWRKLQKFKQLGVLHPKAWPFVGNAAPLLFLRSHFTDVITSVYKLNEEAKYVGFYDFGEPVIVIRSPELMKSIAVKNFDHFADHRNFLDPDSNPLFSKNLVTLRGDKWKEVRNLLSPAFTSSKMKGMFRLMWACGENLVDHLLAAQISKSKVIDSKDSFTRYTNDVIAACAFGISVDSMKNPKNEFYLRGKNASNFGVFRAAKLLLSRLSPTLGKLLKVSLVPRETELFFENVVRETIETREKQGITRPDMIQLMMESREKYPDLTIQDMTAQAFTFFLAGYETTATSMCLVAHELALNSSVQTKLRNEIDDVLTETNARVTYEVINEMRYLEAVVNETLRLYPIGSFIDRLCVKTFQLPPALPGGKPVVIEPGQNIWYPTFAVHRDPKYYPNPEKFDPERFMGSAKSDMEPFAYVPFGQGPRICIGNRFALLEMKVLIFHLLAKCFLKPGPRARSPIELNKRVFNLVPKEGFWLEVEPRHTPQSSNEVNFKTCQ
ncbi:cytochrome P450 9e2-like [Venturia canescens]|uniref:cytochrome P450 9e2-like n=1 Tax=Venturia canescens TaxID=32260 RepID=UPI001C9D1B4F|nr:cytochrome P450 9e2-like [Venturia canescens]